MERVQTIGQAVDYTFKRKDTWIHGNGSKPARINCNHFIRLQGKSFPIRRIDQDTMDTVRDLLWEEDSSNGKINRVTTAVQTALNFCLSRGLLPKLDTTLSWVNHVGQYSFEKLPEKRHIKPTFTKAQVDQMHRVALELLGRVDLADTILFSAYTGMGWDEYTQLRPCDVHLNERIPYIQVGGRPGFTVKRDCRARQIPLQNEQYEKVVPILTRRVADASDGNMLLFGDDWTNDDQHRRAFNRVRDYIGANPRLTPYSLRHSFCTWLIKADVQLTKVQKLMGHSQITTTMNYVHIGSDDLADAVGRL